MEWKILRQGKGQSVQIFTKDFRKQALALNIDLYSHKTLMKYIGALHSYIRHTLLLFNPTKLDEVSVQTTHLENKGKNVWEDYKHSEDHSKRKGKGKYKRTTTTKKEGEKLSCTHCQKHGHDDEHC